MDTGERLWGMVTGYRVSGVAVVAGDFFERVPEGDLLVLKEVLSDWDDRQCVRIPRNCAEALRPVAGSWWWSRCSARSATNPRTRR